MRLVGEEKMKARMIGRCVQQMVDWGRKKGTRVKERQGTLTLGRSRSILAEPLC